MSPVMSTGEKRSTLPASLTCAREFGADDKPLTVPVSAWMPVEKFGSIEKSEKLVLPFSIETVRMIMGIGPALAAGLLAAGGTGAGAPACAARGGLRIATTFSVCSDEMITRP